MNDAEHFILSEKEAIHKKPYTFGSQAAKHKKKLYGSTSSYIRRQLCRRLNTKPNTSS